MATIHKAMQWLKVLINYYRSHMMHLTLPNQILVHVGGRDQQCKEDCTNQYPKWIHPYKWLCLLVEEWEL